MSSISQKSNISKNTNSNGSCRIGCSRAPGKNTKPSSPSPSSATREDLGYEPLMSGDNAFRPTSSMHQQQENGSIGSSSNNNNGDSSTLPSSTIGNAGTGSGTGSGGGSGGDGETDSGNSSSSDPTPGRPTPNRKSNKTDSSSNNNDNNGSTLESQSNQSHMDYQHHQQQQQNNQNNQQYAMSTGRSSSIAPSSSNHNGAHGIPDAPTEPWMPSGGYDGLCDLSLETISVIGLTGQASYLESLFNKYLLSPKEMRTSELASAFVVGAGHQARRSLLLVRPMFKTLANLTELNHEGLERLATILADVCCRDSVEIVLNRCMDTKMSMLFYHALIRAVTESAKVPDLNLAVRIVNEMVARGYKHTDSSTRMIMVGFTRNPHDAIGLQTCLNIMDWRLAISSSNIEPTFAHHFYSVLEAASGSQVPQIINYLNDILPYKTPDLERKLISAVADPNKANSDCCGEGQEASTYNLVDPYTLSLPTVTTTTTSSNNNGGGSAVTSTTTTTVTNYTLPPKTYVMFLYSAVRDMCSKIASLGEDHPLQTKIVHVRNLLKENPKQCWVLTLSEELNLRPPGSNACVTPHCRMIAFATGVNQCMDGGSCTFNAITSDPTLEVAIRRRVPTAQVAKQLPIYIG